MTRLELFKALCDVTDALEKVTYAEPSTGVAGVIRRLDSLIDRCVREGLQPLHAADTSPCPACGKRTCTHWKIVRGVHETREVG